MALRTVTELARLLPKFTMAPDTKFVPVMFITVPTLPTFGETPLIVGAELAAKKVKAEFKLAAVEAGTCTLMLTVPAGETGVTA